MKIKLKVNQRMECQGIIMQIVTIIVKVITKIFEIKSFKNKNLQILNN